MITTVIIGQLIWGIFTNTPIFAEYKYYKLMSIVRAQESGNTPDTVNVSGHKGLYQFSDRTLRHLGHPIPRMRGRYRIDTSNFTRRIQDSLFVVLAKQLEYKYLKRYMNKSGYSNDAIIYAGLIGHMKVIRYFRNKVDGFDGYGITVSSRLKRYKMSLR